MNNAIVALIIIGGIYNLGFTVFHLFFWKVFRWRKDLASISRVNRALMQILNLCLTFMILLMAYVSIFQVHDLIYTNLGNAIVMAISVFWLFRMIEQVIFFGLKNRGSIVFTFIFALGFLLYLVAFLLIKL